MTADLLYNPSKSEEFSVKGKSTQSDKDFAAAMFLLGLALIVAGITQL